MVVKTVESDLITDSGFKIEELDEFNVATGANCQGTVSSPIGSLLSYCFVEEDGK
ncbi:hypothetical protein NONO_c00040 [Nocardia nova SH22a]|uniref:Uncharacterized protein n=1 Tax=Nocardia nova SH22a TaxID=1415166 RepID=W5T6K0_9NOCA|nr:hypothetical protein [Nocardia nova]AHH14827.1 hypothetical protein NONO_c00040 [Nocardia nova SH22a]